MVVRGSTGPQDRVVRGSAVQNKGVPEPPLPILLLYFDFYNEIENDS